MAAWNTQFVYRSHEIDPDQTIEHLIQSIPEALPFLIGTGFTPLADPVLRGRLAPTVTIRQAAETLPTNLERLLVNLERLGKKSRPTARVDLWPLD